MEAEKIKIFTTPTCAFCVMAKEYFRLKGIAFEEKNVADDMDARSEMVKISGQMGTPVIVIDGQVVIGFNQEMLDRILTKK